jgi:3-deoxy-manno-octulosonate cytidylyltransferase (CMP-KDO synthetase)
MFFSEPILKTVGIIPARMASTRLPEKPLVSIAGKPMIQRVWEGASKSERMEKVIIATDNQKIADVCVGFGAEIIMTPPELPSGTDRIAYAYEKLNLDYDAIVNIQGDEPLIEGKEIDKLIDGLTGSLANVGTFIKRIESESDLTDPNTVKVVMQSDNTALYFSRGAIPYLRDNTKGYDLTAQPYYKHIGIYAYREAALKAFASLPPTELEQSEKLEQLRLMQNNYKYICVETKKEFIAVDTSEDVAKVEKVIAANSQ